MIPHGNRDPFDWADAFTRELDDGMHAHRGTRLTAAETRVISNYSEQWFEDALETGEATCGTDLGAALEVGVLEKENAHLKEVRDLQADLIDSYKLVIEQLQYSLHAS